MYTARNITSLSARTLLAYVTLKLPKASGATYLKGDSGDENISVEKEWDLGFIIHCAAERRGDVNSAVEACLRPGEVDNHMMFSCPLSTSDLHRNNWSYLNHDLTLLSFYTIMFQHTESTAETQEPGRFLGMFIKPGMPLHK